MGLPRVVGGQEGSRVDRSHWEYWDVSSAGLEHYLDKVGVPGSNPVRPTGIVVLLASLVSNPGDPKGELTVDNRQLIKFSPLVLKVKVLDKSLSTAFVQLYTS